MMALKLNEKLLTQQVIEAIPYKESKSLCTSLIKHTNNFINDLIYKWYLLFSHYTTVELTTTNMPDIYVEKLLKFIASELESTRHIHFYLLWIETILTKHGSRINTALQMPVLLLLQKNMQKKYDDLSRM